MPATIEAPPDTGTDPFSDLVSGNSVSDYGTFSDLVPKDEHSPQWNQSQADMASRAAEYGLPQASDSRSRLIDAISRVESSGFRTPHFIGLPNEPTGDRGVSRDVENLVTSLKKQEASLPVGPQRDKIAKERAYWEEEAAQGMSLAEWKAQTGEGEVLYPEERSNFGQFADLVPQSPTGETEKAVAETPDTEKMSDLERLVVGLPPKKPAESNYMKLEKGMENMTGQPIHQTLNALRNLAAGAGKYIFNGLQGFEFNRARVLANPPSELTKLQGDELVLPNGSIMSKEQQDALEQKYHDEAIAQIPDAKATADYFKQLAGGTDAALGVDPALANTIPARLAHTVGSAGTMALESLLPGAGIPLMVFHGALATEAEAKNAGKTDQEAEAAGVRSAIGLALFGGASKLAGLGVAELLPEGAASLTKFISQFTGQAVANETSSRAINAWNAASDAPEGKKIETALNALKDTTLEQSTLNAVYALAHASKAAGKEPVRPASASEPQTPTGTPEVQPAMASEPIAQAPKAEVYFRTSKGSVYKVHDDGTTTRNKSVHPEHPGDEGLKPTSAATFYVTPEQALNLAEVQARGIQTELAQLPDGRWGMRYTAGPNAGKFEGRTVTEVSKTPAVGLQPVEIWQGEKPHFGNQITEVGEAPSVSSAPLAATEPGVSPAKSEPIGVADAIAEIQRRNAPEPIPPPERVSDDPFVSRIANRFTEERAKTGQIGEIAPGQGYATSDLVKRGLKMAPEEINQHVSDIMNDAGGDPIKQAAAIRAEEARLSDRSTELSRVAEANPRDLMARQAANSAFQDLTDFHNGPVAKLKTRFHATGMALQGEIPVDLSTVNGLREKWLKDNNQPPPASMESTFSRTAENVRRATAEEKLATDKLGKEIEKATKGRKLPTADEVRSRIAQRMKDDLPCRI